jgi:8-oxo-dGTP diphosphatase
VSPGRWHAGAVAALAEDERGNVLLAFQPCAEADLSALDPLPLAVVVVVRSGDVLLVHDRRRGQWELPGGMLEPGETPRSAALRELHEETGLAVVGLELVGAAEFELRPDGRREHAAVFRHQLSGAGALAPLDADEVDGTQWWTPGTPLAGLAALDGWLPGQAVTP